jgi:hypothetical protein
MKLHLRVIMKRQRCVCVSLIAAPELLGLYPETGRQSVLVASISSGTGGVPTIEFVVPTKRPEVPADAPGHAPYPWQKRLSAPREMVKDEYGIWSEVK